MLSRYSWLVLLGPPLLAVIVAGLAVRFTPWVRGAAATTPAPMSACRPDAYPSTGAPPPVPGTWWRAAAELDANGGLAAWNVTFGAPGASDGLLRVGPASTVSGPRGGTIAVAEDDGTASAIHLVRPGGACAEIVDVGSAIARRSAIDPATNAPLVHLLERASRRDLGIWLIPGSGALPSLVMPPVEKDILERAGIETVWTTDLRASDDSHYLAVQSCDPDACLIRIQDRRTGTVATLNGSSGALVGFVGTHLVTMGVCTGLPCPVLAWDAAGGSARELVSSGLAAAAMDGEVIVAETRNGAILAGIAIDPDTGRRRSIGALDADGLPLASLSGLAGIEAEPGAIGVLRPDGVPALRDLPSPPAPAPHSTEVPR